MYIKSIDPETGRAVISIDQEGNADQAGFLRVRPGGMVVFQPVDERPLTVAGYEGEGSETVATRPKADVDPLAQQTPTGTLRPDEDDVPREAPLDQPPAVKITRGSTGEEIPVEQP